MPEGGAPREIRNSSNRVRIEDVKAGYCLLMCLLQATVQEAREGSWSHLPRAHSPVIVHPPVTTDYEEAFRA